MLNCRFNINVPGTFHWPSRDLGRSQVLSEFSTHGIFNGSTDPWSIVGGKGSAHSNLTTITIECE